MRYILIAALVLGLGFNYSYAGDKHRGHKPESQMRNEKLINDIGSLAIELAKTIVTNVDRDDDETFYVIDNKGRVRLVIDEDEFDDLKDEVEDNNRDERRVIIRYETQRFRPVPIPFPVPDRRDHHGPHGPRGPQGPHDDDHRPDHH